MLWFVTPMKSFELTVRIKLDPYVRSRTQGAETIKKSFTLIGVPSPFDAAAKSHPREA
jgi:hypothetical protein